MNTNTPQPSKGRSIAKGHIDRGESFTHHDDINCCPCPCNAPTEPDRDINVLISTEPEDGESLEEKLLQDKSFQHILKFAPQSQRELMTFEIAKYFSNFIPLEEHNRKMVEAEGAAMIKEAQHRCSDALDRLIRLDRNIASQYIQEYAAPLKNQLNRKDVK